MKINVFGAPFEKKNNYALLHVYWQINDDSESIFDADQLSEVYLAENDYSLALICKESTKTHTYKTVISNCNTI